MQEIFRQFNDRIEVSNLGRVKRDGIIIDACQGEPYDYICTEGKVIRVHNMVGELFPEICGQRIKYGVLHHINHNQRDNRAENLVWLSNSEHMKLHKKEEEIGIPVRAYDLEGNCVGEWDNINQAAIATGQEDHRHIRAIVNGKENRYTAGGLIWVRQDESEEEIMRRIDKVLGRTKRQLERAWEKEERRIIKEQKNILRLKYIVEKEDKKKILELDVKGNVLKVWDCVADICKKYHLSDGTIYNNLRGESKYVKIKNGGTLRRFIRKGQYQKENISTIL